MTLDLIRNITLKDFDIVKQKFKKNSGDLNNQF